MKQNLETKVGLFLMFGIGIICTLIVFFGEVQGFFKPTYNLTVQFPDASGLLKGSDVYLSGAVIGKVTTDPHPIPDTQLVEVHLKIDSNVKLREGSKYVIGSSGLLGDRFVDVQPFQYPEGATEDQKKPYVKDGETIQGTSSTGLSQLADSAEPLIKKANHIADQLDQMITKLNVDVLSGTSTDDLKATITNLRNMVKNGDDLLEQAKNGQGVLGRLINDKKTGDNLAAFIANLKEHGPMFYSDSSAKKDDKDKDGKKK